MRRFPPMTPAAAVLLLLACSLQAAEKKATHWAFQPPQRPPLPAVKQLQLVGTPVDRFIVAALEARNLTLNPEANRATLIRRVSFDLTGLPPTSAEIDAFLHDQSADAYERMVDRYLASPCYGERWGKYWLEAAGYADSNGYFSADSDRPLAYRYRDYVIRSFNQDKPYDRFVREQLAGDEIAGYVPGGDVTAANIELLTATHFLRNAPDGTGESDGNPDEVRIDRYTVLEGNLQNTMSCLLGLTIQCARCHNHKFEPIKQREYYSLQAILFSAYCPDRWTVPKDRVIEIGTKVQREEHHRRTDQIDRQIKALQSSLEPIAGPFREQLIEERLKNVDAADRAAVLKALQTPKEKLTPEQQALLKKHANSTTVSDDDLAKRFPEYAAVRNEVRQATAAREKDRLTPLEKVAVFVETDPNPPVHHILVRGQHDKPGSEVRPGVLAALCTPQNNYQVGARPPGRISTGRRTAFANWVTSPENPLFARVMVNRIWQHHFGTGIVATSGNLGQSAAKPSHPELLDYLATEFLRCGWSVKALHRLILKSAVYRQASGTAANVDPDNRLLSHFSLRRLDAEAVRDAMLSVSGELDHRLGGPYIQTRRTDEGSVEVDESLGGARRRSVYLQQRRSQVVTMLELFDAPSVISNCTFRNTSTVPLQSLALLNSPFARARAGAFTRRLDREGGSETDRRIALAFRLACGRNPGADEVAVSKKFVAAQEKLYSGEKDAANRVWTDFCQMMLASNAFLYVE